MRPLIFRIANINNLPTLFPSCGNLYYRANRDLIIHGEDTPDGEVHYILKNHRAVYKVPVVVREGLRAPYGVYGEERFLESKELKTLPVLKELESYLKEEIVERTEELENISALYARCFR